MEEIVETYLRKLYNHYIRLVYFTTLHALKYHAPYKYNNTTPYFMCFCFQLRKLTAVYHNPFRFFLSSFNDNW